MGAIVIEAISPQEMLARHKAAGGIWADPPSRDTRMQNVDEALQLGAPLVFRYRNRKIVARPLPFHAGVRLMQLAEAAEDAANRKDWPEYAKHAGEAMRVCWQHAGHPRLPRWVQRLRRNPFRDASMAEVREILSFFGRCQMLSLAGTPSTTGRARRRT